MAAPHVAVAGLPALRFNRDVLDGNGNVNLEIRSNDPALLKAVQENRVPSPTQSIIVASTNLRVDQELALKLGAGGESVAFSAGATGKLGIFGPPGQLRDGIVDGGDLAESIEEALDFSNGSNQPFLMLRLGYDAGSTASGAIALGAAETLRLSANRRGLYAIVRQPAATDGFADSLQSLVGGVRLPKQVKSPDDILPGTWIVAEADGKIGLRANVRFGFDFSWIRKTKLDTLTGDIGLKVANGIAAGLGFNAAGKYGVVVSRPSPKAEDKVIRLSVYKLRAREIDGAIGAEATVTPVAGILPDQFDDLLRGVLGVHSNQIVRLLGKVDDWTNPKTPIFGPFVNLAADQASEIIRRITGVNDLNAGFDQAKGRIKDLIDRWNRLPADAASRILAAASDREELGRVRQIVQELRNASEDELRDKVSGYVSDVSFLGSNEGRVIEKLAVDGLFPVLANRDLLRKFRDAVTAACDLLDGSTLQNALATVQAEINNRLDINQIEAAINSADPARLDAWARARLEAFLEEKLAGEDGAARLRELRDSIRNIRAAVPELYKKALAALDRDYKFSLNAAFRNARSSEALIDVDFDFAAEGSEAAEMLRLALLGRFDDVITGIRKGVSVHDAALTYAIRRESNVSLVFPFFERKSTHINEATAKMRRVAQNGGQLFFEMEGRDMAAVRNEYTSALTISMQLLREDRKSDVIVHDSNTAKYVQSLDRAFTRAGTDELIRYATPFAPALIGQDAAALRATLEEAFGVNAQLGKALLALDVTLPPEACLAWLNAPSDRKARVYQELSTRIQTRFKQLIHDTYFQRVERYNDLAAAATVLVFCSIPPCTKARLDGGDIRIVTVNNEGEVYWDHADPDLRRGMARAAAIEGTLLTRLATARARIQAAGDPCNTIGFYKQSQAGNIVKAAEDSEVLKSLLVTEARLVEKVIEAALELAEFRQNQAEDPEKARKKLAEFGADVTNAFNTRLKNLAVGDALLPLGAVVFAEAAQTLDPQLQARASAMLSITDVKDTIAFPPANFPDCDPVPPEDIVRTQTVVHSV